MKQHGNRTGTVKIYDRYILASFWRNLAIGLIAFSVIYITVDVNEEIETYIDRKAEIADIASYYFFKIPWIVILILPVSVLLSTVFSLGKLSRQNELTAFITSGTPLVRIAAPIIYSSILISLFTIAFGEYVIPYANRKCERIMLVNIEKKKSRGSHRYKTNLHYQGENNRVYYAEKYDRNMSSLINTVIQEYRGAKLYRRIDAKKAFWDGEKWVFLDGMIREFIDEGEKITTFDRMPMRALTDKPDDLAKEEIEPEEMNFTELKEYIDKVRRGGGPVNKYLVDLHFKFSFPFTNLIFSVIGIALSSAKHKPSLATGFGMTLLISFTYYGILRIGQALGHSGVMEPLLGAWIGNIIFFMVGGILLYRANR